MRTVTILAISIFLSMLAPDRGGRGAIDLFFTGDDRGWLVPAG